MSQSYRDIVTEDQRLTVLRFLMDEPDYATNEHVLRKVLAERGHDISAAQLRGHLAWLDEQGLVIAMGDQVRIARLTTAGDDVARGRSAYPGVARPGP